MKHGERLGLARQVAKKLLEKYKDRVLYIGIYGSTARKEDRAHSDLELLAITKNKIGSDCYPFKDILLYVEYKTLEQANRAISTVEENWPVEAGQILSSAPLYDRNKLMAGFRKKIKLLKREEFIRVAEKILNLSVENVGKFENAFESGSIAQMREAMLINFITELNEFVALINQKYFTRSELGMLEDMNSFERLPKDYIRLCMICWQSNSLEEIYQAGQQLWKNCMDFARKNGIRIKYYNSLNEIRF